MPALVPYFFSKPSSGAVFSCPKGECTLDKEILRALQKIAAELHEIRAILAREQLDRRRGQTGQEEQQASE